MYSGPTTYVIIEAARAVLKNSAERNDELDALLRQASHAARNDECIFLAFYELLKSSNTSAQTVTLLQSLQERVDSYKAA